MTAEKLSISLDPPLLEFLTQYQRVHQVRSKSEVLSRALALLREQELEQQYAEAMAQWQSSGEADLWDTVVGDGLGPSATR